MLSQEFCRLDLKKKKKIYGKERVSGKEGVREGREKENRKGEIGREIWRYKTERLRNCECEHTHINCSLIYRLRL